MMVVNSFDQWKKDAFFSAAELVQESADIMESAFRAWLRERRESSSLYELDLLSRDLQTALGTAKWQLEEFERAVRSSYRHWGDENANNRHKQFISAIESQISRVEVALTESFLEEGRQPLRWVNLNEEECDDLAAFLSGTSCPMQSIKDKCAEFSPSDQSSLEKNQISRSGTDTTLCTAGTRDTFDDTQASRDASSSNTDAVVIDIKPDITAVAKDDAVCRTDRATNVRRAWCSNFGALRIVIPDEDDVGTKSMKTVEDTPKVKGYRAVFWKSKCGEYSQAMGATNIFNRMCCRMGQQLPHKFQGPFKLQNRCSVPITLALMLSIMLIVPFVFYST